MSYSIGIWDDESTRSWAGVYAESDLSGFSVSQNEDPDVLVERVLSNAIDVALLPPDTVLRNIRDLDILPAVCLSAVESPFAVVELKSVEDLTPVILKAPPGKKYYKLIGEIVLKEHFGIGGVIDPGTGSSLDTRSDFEVRTLPVTSSPPGEGFILNLGREWFELVSYPLICALFVCRRRNATSEMISAIRDTTIQIDVRKGSWISSQKLSPEHAEFYMSRMGFRLDDIAVASLTNLCEYMYYYGVTTEIPTFSLASLEDTDTG